MGGFVVEGMPLISTVPSIDGQSQAAIHGLHQAPDNYVDQNSMGPLSNVLTADTSAKTACQGQAAKNATAGHTDAWQPIVHSTGIRHRGSIVPHAPLQVMACQTHVLPALPQAPAAQNLDSLILTTTDRYPYNVRQGFAPGTIGIPTLGEMAIGQPMPGPGQPVMAIGQLASAIGQPVPAIGMPYLQTITPDNPSIQQQQTRTVLDQQPGRMVMLTPALRALRQHTSPAMALKDEELGEHAPGPLGPSTQNIGTEGQQCGDGVHPTQQPNQEEAPQASGPDGDGGKAKGDGMGGGEVARTQGSSRMSVRRVIRLPARYQTDDEDCPKKPRERKRAGQSSQRPGGRKVARVDRNTAPASTSTHSDQPDLADAAREDKCLVAQPCGAPAAGPQVLVAVDAPVGAGAAEEGGVAVLKPTRVKMEPTSKYRGVSKHSGGEKWEASIWVEGRQRYLGSFEDEQFAARIYDIAALTLKDDRVRTNFPREEYDHAMREIQALAMRESEGNNKKVIYAYIRRISDGFARGRSQYRGVSAAGQSGKWEARVGVFKGKQNKSLGVYPSEEVAARQYDRALIIEKGDAAATNFPISDYIREVEIYEQSLIEKCGTIDGPESDWLRASATLPLGRVGNPNSRAHCLLYVEDLRKALRGL
ncbi:unnamed protein product [Ostreobium quekettii]|uniref:AP2/ERF domain-containing protein n=1 Tax=Ostreobium quekettii TaxID=121088 RepID=A0A8S1IXP8_9CHLO|nr:unnamed protein product [Ostreobium quekettii]|eukprot:evm.model.scf_1060.2 EVM.evm.TU.scf_1060.2   scf_1060:3692-9227(-)